MADCSGRTGGPTGPCSDRSSTGGAARRRSDRRRGPGSAPWDRWAADGDGDGRADPQDLDDAALAAGRYLCGAGGDVAVGSGWVTAVRAYNNADAYVRAVYDAASAYATRVGSD